MVDERAEVHRSRVETPGFKRRHHEHASLSSIEEITAPSGTHHRPLRGGWLDHPDRIDRAIAHHAVSAVDAVHRLIGLHIGMHAETAPRFAGTEGKNVSALSITLDDGARFTLDGSSNASHGRESRSDATSEVTGTHGVIDMDCFARRIQVTREKTPADLSSVFHGTDPDRLLLQRFAETVRGRDPASPGETARRSTTDPSANRSRSSTERDHGGRSTERRQGEPSRRPVADATHDSRDRRFLL